VSVAPYAGVVALDNFKSPTASEDGLQGQVPKPLAGQQTYILSASGWVATGSGGIGTVTSVDATVPAFLSVSGVPITTSGTIAITYSGTALPVANGGTGVTASTGANSVVLRDADQNITVNSISEGYSNVAAAGTTTVLTAASVPNYVVTGSGGQTYQLPNATTLPNGVNFTFNNNQTSGAITVNNNSGTLIVSVPSGAFVDVSLLSNAIAAGSWDIHFQSPSNVSWSTNTFSYAGSITNATWNGNVIAYNRGGTGQSSVFVAGGVVYGSTTTAMAVTAAGTSGQVLTSAGASAPTFSSSIDGVTIGGTTPAAGSFTTLIGGAGSANYEQITGGATTKAVQFQTLGTDANISMALQPKGTGAIDLAAGSSGVNISNGGTVTAVTITAGGASYTAIPTVVIPAPTTAGGVQAAATVAMSHLSSSTISSGGTGYSVSDTLTIVGGTTGTAATFTVTSVSSGVVTGITRLNTSTYTVLPSSPSATTVSPAGGTGCTIAVSWAINSAAVTITTAGSGYVEQPTITFSGGGSGSGATAYAVVGAGSVIRALGATGTQSLDVYTPSSITSSIPAFRFRDSSNADSYPMVWSYAGSANIIGQGNSTGTMRIGANGTGSVAFSTSGTTTIDQMRVSHTASAVNYVQITGGTAGNPPVISAQGATTPDLDLTLTPKGAGRINITTSIKPKVSSATNVTSPLAWNSTSFDEYAITALANALTINADANTSPADGQRMMFRFKDNGTAQTLTWTTGSARAFRVVGVTLPTTTVASKLVYIGCIYNAADSRWDAVAVSQEA